MNEIIEEINKRIEFYKNSHPSNDYEKGCDKGAVAALEGLKEKLSSLGWHTGTPTEEKRYLVYYGKPGRYHEIIMLTWNPHYNVWDDFDGDDYYCDPEMVSHWMELPEIPQEG